MSGGYELVIQGETTLLTQRMQRNQELNEHGEIAVSWAIPQSLENRANVTCLFFCEFTLQIMLPLIKSGSLDKPSVARLVDHVARRVKQIADSFSHVYVFDFVSCINWQHQGYANATSALGESQLKLFANAKLADSLSEIPEITLIPQRLFWGDSLPKINKEYYARTSSIFSVSNTDRFISHLLEFLGDLARPRIKCICLDLDDTIWGGTAGELDDPAELELGGISPRGRAFQLLQYVLRELRLCGIYLAVVSKNSTAVVQKFFNGSPEMILDTSDISHFELGFSDKSRRIELIAKNLNIGLDAVMFIDDNPAERGIVKSKLPEVTVLEVGSSPEKFADILASSSAIRAPFLVEEDYGRCKAISDSNFHSFDGDGGLDLSTEIRVCSASAAYHQRLFQLINKTNQFTNTGSRVSRSELKQYFHSKSLFIFSAFAKDEYSDLGLVGIIFGEKSDQGTKVQGFILSAGAFGRMVEHKMIDAVLENTAPDGEVIVQYLATGKNALAIDFIRNLPTFDPRIKLEACVDESTG